MYKMNHLYLFEFCGYKVIVSAENRNKAQYRLYKYAINTCYEGSFFHFVRDEITLVERWISDDEANELYNTDKADWI